MIAIYLTILISDFMSRTFISIQQLQQFFLDARYVAIINQNQLFVRCVCARYSYFFQNIDYITQYYER